MCQFSRLPDNPPYSDPAKVYASVGTVDRLQEKLDELRELVERQARELKLWRESHPGWMYSERHNMLVDAGGSDYGW